MTKLFIENPETDKNIREIRRLLHLLKNGVVADSMKEKGIVYKMNWGVDIPRIKEIAGMFEPNHDLAQRLWSFGIREMQILATILEPTDKFSEENALQWIEEINNIELAEQIAMNLLNRLPYKNDLIIRLIGSEEPWSMITGFTLATRNWQELTDVQTGQIIERAFRLIEYDNYFLYKSIGVLLGRLCRRNKTTAEEISGKLNQLRGNEQPALRFIRHEVEGELSFLEN